jgi:hypothetical protein
MKGFSSLVQEALEEYLRRQGGKKVETLMAGVTILPLNDTAARRAGEIHRELEQSGSTIEMADSLIFPSDKFKILIFGFHFIASFIAFRTCFS